MRPEQHVDDQFEYADLRQRRRLSERGKAKLFAAWEAGETRRKRLGLKPLPVPVWVAEWKQQRIT